MFDFGSWIGILIIVLGLVISVALHELGHMLPAKAFGADVPEFAVGFGPSLWSKNVGSTTYHIRAVPLGGYVRILGILRPAPAGADCSYEALRASMSAAAQPASLAAGARQESAREILAHPQLRPMYSLPWLKKLIIMSGGPLVNLLLALALILTAYSAIGVKLPTTTVATVTTCQEASVCGAFEAGLKPGDQITSIGGTPVESWDETVAAIRQSSPGTQLEIGYLRENQAQTLAVPVGQVDNRSAIGVVPELARQHFSVWQSLSVLGQQIQDTVRLLVRLPQSVWVRTSQIFGYNLDNREVPVSLVGVVQMGSAIGSSSAPDLSFADRLGGYLNVLAALNLALFLFNLLPLLPLDGGHILASLYEGLRNAYRRLRGKPPAGAPDVARLVPLSYVVVAVFLAMTVILVIADFVTPLV